jgi:DNA-binding SARP family transcriptional activator/predicted ATPase
MSQLTLNLLGDLEVVRDGVVLPLPPSKKTRALLAYLALQDRSYRREALCELLWEVPDDPRGSLRWSLSKLRRLVDEPDRPRVVADRSTVRFDREGLEIDLLLLEDAVLNLANQSVDDLERLAAKYRGNLLEGLDLPNFHDYHSWCLATRESAVRAQTVLLEHLVERLENSGERALPYARSLVGLLPYDEALRAGLVRRLMETGRTDEAKQQVNLGERMLKEAGIAPSGALFSAWRGEPGRRLDAPKWSAGGDPVGSTAADVSDDADRSPPSHRKFLGSGEGLVGRESECGQLRSLLARVSGEGRSQTLLVRGEPGIGKSRLLEWTSTLVDSSGGLLIEAGAFESETLRPYALWIDALRRLGQVNAVFTEDKGDDRDRLYANLSNYLLGLPDDRPTVVMFDDVQWADESSLAAAHYVTRMCRDRPLLLILAGREGELQDNAALQQVLRGLRQDGQLQEIRLGPLSEVAICELIAQTAPDAECEVLSRSCGGNPLLAIELARAGREGGGSLDELVAGRLDRFDLDGAEVLRWAAVLSPRIDLAMLTALTGQTADAVAKTLARAESQAILRPAEQGFRFAHDLIASGMYAQIPQARRQLMHRRVAERIEEKTALDLEHAADLAHHALSSSDAGLAARALVSAGKLCLRFFANDDALVLARKGLQLARELSGAEGVCRRIELFDVMLTAAPVRDWEAAAEEYAALAELALEHGELAHARLGYHMSSTVRWANGHWSGAQEETLQSEMITRGAGESEHLVGMAEAAKCLAMLERDLNRAEAMAMEARALSGPSPVVYHALPLAEGILRYIENDMTKAESLLREARTLCKSAGDHISEYQANEYLAMAELERERFEAARERTDVLVELGSKIREGSEEPFARALSGLCALALEGDGTLLAEAVDALREVDAKHRLAYVQNRAAVLELGRGEFDSARQRAEEALRCAGLLERTSEMLMARGVLASVADGAEDVEGGAAHRQAIAELLGRSPAAWAVSRVRRYAPDLEEKTL